MIDLSDRAELSLYAEVVGYIQSATRSEFFLCGATARDLLLQYAHGIPTHRATQDIDFGVMVESLNEFQAIRRTLVATGRFTIVTDMTRLHYGDIRVDLIPFGAVEGERRIVTWPPGDVELNTLGYREALTSAIDVRLPLEVTVKVASLPIQALLKLIAWGDRNPKRGSKDAQDFRVIATSYYRVLDSDRLYDQQHLLDRNDFDVQRVGAWLLGNDGGKQLRQNAGAVLDRVCAITAAQLDEQAALTLVSSMGGPSVDENLQLLRWFSEGLQAAIRKS